MFAYRKTRSRVSAHQYEVGFFDPSENRTFMTLSNHTDEAEAMERVHYLNGGDHGIAIEGIAPDRVETFCSDVMAKVASDDAGDSNGGGKSRHCKALGRHIGALRILKSIRARFGLAIDERLEAMIREHESESTG